MLDSSLTDIIANGIEPLWLPWEGPTPRVILSSACIFRRNVEGMLFPPFNGDESQAQTAHDTVCAVFDKHPEFGFTQKTAPRDLSSFEKISLAFSGLASRDFLSTADYRTLMVSTDLKNAVRINDSNHLTILKSAPLLGLTELVSEMNGMMAEIGMDVPFARDPYFGYLCTEAELCGTGFSAHVHVNLPGLLLMGYGTQIQNASAELGFSISFNRIREKNKEYYSNHVVRIDAANLPHCTPSAIVMKLNDFAKRMERHELDARAKLLGEAHVNEARDIIGRAAGTIAGSWALDPTDAAVALATLWAGFELGIRTMPISQKEFFKLYTTMMIQEQTTLHKIPSISNEERSTLLKTTLNLTV